MAMDYGICKGKRKDGKPCSMPVNKAQGGGFCEFHVVAAFNRAQRQDSLQKSSKGNSSGTNSTGLVGLRAKLQLGTGLGVYGTHRIKVHLDAIRKFIMLAFCTGTVIPPCFAHNFVKYIVGQAHLRVYPTRQSRHRTRATSFFFYFSF